MIALAEQVRMLASKAITRERLKMWLAVLEADDGSWADDPLPTDGTKDVAIDNAQCMWPVIPKGHRIALYRCEYVQDVEQWAPTQAYAVAKSNEN